MNDNSIDLQIEVFRCYECKVPSEYPSEDELGRHYLDSHGFDPRERYILTSNVQSSNLVSDVTDQVTAQVNALLNKNDASKEIEIKTEPTDDYEMQAEPNEVTECIEAFLEEHRTIKDTGELLLSIYLQFDRKTYYNH